MRKIVAVTVTTGALVALGILGAGALAAPSGKHAGQGWARAAGGDTAKVIAAGGKHAQHLVLFARTLREDFVNVGGSGEGTGDSIFFEEVLRNAARTRNVGTSAVECRIGIRTFNCAGTLLLFGKGKIMAQGALFDERDSVIPVTGGTGKFAGVGGQLMVTDVSANVVRYDLWLVR
ncbi:MAG: Allene oxide cyclase [Gaiellales bacterium]|nr:Allene oxide cyclase [Gaiellales bacterium]